MGAAAPGHSLANGLFLAVLPAHHPAISAAKCLGATSSAPNRELPIPFAAIRLAHDFLSAQVILDMRLLGAGGDGLLCGFALRLSDFPHLIGGDAVFVDKPVPPVPAPRPDLPADRTMSGLMTPRKSFFGHGVLLGLAQA
jgi:hypothetical protein